MRSYPTPPAGSKLAVTAPDAPARWPLAARLAITWTRNAHYTRGAGSRRRSRMEYRLAAARDWLRHMLRGDRLEVGGEQLDLARALVLGEQARAQLGHYAPSTARIRQLVTLATSTGPAAGWAFTDERTRGPRGPVYVRLYLPRRCEPAARAWLRCVRELRALLARVGRLASRLIPALRTSSTTARSTTVWRDHQSAGGELPAWLEAVRRRRAPDGAM